MARDGLLLLRLTRPDPKAGRNVHTKIAIKCASLFQSSPDPKAGRNAAATPARVHPNSSNPRPTRRPGATLRGDRRREAGQRVPILARPEGRAQRIPRPANPSRRACSNPRPTRRPGATLPRPGLAMPSWFQSSPDPKAGRNLACRDRPVTLLIVPILARPEGRAQLRRFGVHYLIYWFQSSPDPKAGRNAYRHGSTRGCRCSNPRPTRRPGATKPLPRHGAPKPTFQSSPDPKAGRNPEQGIGLAHLGRVPILARPEGRAQPLLGHDGIGGHVVPILARPEGRAQRCGMVAVVASS